MIRFSGIGLMVALTACGHGSGQGSPPLSESPVITVPNLLTYFAQSKTPDSGLPLGFSDPWTYKRFDFGHYQVEQSFLRADGISAQTIWSYPPFGQFVAANGDGGEVYSFQNGAAYITSTQDGGTPGIQNFDSVWWVADQYVPPCASGWRNSPDGLGRACTETITYPTDNGTMIADSIVSEHYSLSNLDGALERAYYGKGWGRLAWQAWKPVCSAPLDPSRKPPMSFDGPPKERASWVQCDSRIVTNIAYSDGSLSGASFGWP